MLEAFVSKKRDRKAALKFLRKLMKRYPRPDAIITDRLRSYRAALRELGGSGRHQAGRWLNNLRRIPTCRSGDENTQCSVSGGCEASRNLPPSILPSTTTSTCDDPSAHGTISSLTAPLHLPSGVNSGRPKSLSPVENSDLLIFSDSALGKGRERNAAAAAQRAVGSCKLACTASIL